MPTKTKVSKITNNLYIGCNNIEQQINWLEKGYKKLNKTEKDYLKSKYENTYVIGVIELIENKIKSSKKIKKVEEKTNESADTKGE